MGWSIKQSLWVMGIAFVMVTLSLGIGAGIILFLGMGLLFILLS